MVGLHTLTPPASAQPGGPSAVVAQQVRLGEINDVRSFVGTVLPSKKSVIGSAVEGRVVELSVNDGDRVEKDQVLARLLTTTIQLELAAAEAELELRVEEERELLNGSRPKEIMQAKAALDRAAALHEYAKARLARAESLYSRGGSTSQEQLDQDRSAAAAAMQSVIEAQAAYDLMLEGAREEAKLQAKARKEMQLAVRDRLQDQVDKYTIKAPFSGYVTAEFTEQGEWVSRADPIVELAALNPVEVTVSVPEDHIAALVPGASAGVRIESLGKEMQSHPITRIVPQADVRSRSFPIKIEMDNPDTRFKAGMLANVELTVGRKQALLVHKDAIVLGGGQGTVFVVQGNPASPDATVAPVPVEMGIAAGDYIEVTGGLREGQWVVTRGNERLRPGMSVAVTCDNE